jgi:LPXTG-motif cell wall-anchored protein
MRAIEPRGTMDAKTLRTSFVSTVPALGVFAGPAFADHPPAEPPQVDGQVHEVEDVADAVDDGDGDEVEVRAVAAMPVTGADARALAAGGIGLLALGGLALRRREPTGTP